MCGVQIFGNLGCFSRAQNRQLSMHNTKLSKIHKSELADVLKIALFPYTQIFR